MKSGAFGVITHLDFCVRKFAEFFDCLYISLPDESQVASMFGMSSLPSDFGLMLVFRCLAGSKNVTLAGIYDQNGSVQSYTLAVGDSIILLVAKVPYFGYFLINYTS